jgi:hypothetical protein
LEPVVLRFSALPRGTRVALAKAMDKPECNAKAVIVSKLVGRLLCGFAIVGTAGWGSCDADPEGDGGAEVGGAGVGGAGVGGAESTSQATSGNATNSAQGSTADSSSASTGAGLNTFDIVVSDMTDPHEGILSGVPTSYDWGAHPRVGHGNNVPTGWNAMTGWGQVYFVEGSVAPVNTRVQLRNLKSYMLSKSTRVWTQVQDSPDVEGAAFAEDFGGNNSMGADIRDEAEGISVRLSVGWNFHFWSANGRHTFNPSDVGAFLVTFHARIIRDDATQPLNPNGGELLAGAGGDYWKDASAPWDNFKTNGDFAIGRMKRVTEEWRAFNAHTADEMTLLMSPPPLE